jgi:hypothetical protein
MQLLAAVAVHQHRSPNALVVVVVVAFALLYIAWRTGRIKPLRSRPRALNWRAELRESGISPLSFIPLAVLVIVVVVLLLGR